MWKLTGKLSLAFVGAIALAWIFFGLNSVWAQDATGEPEVVATVEVPADAPVIVGVPVEATGEAPDITVEDGGTVVINEQPEVTPAPEPALSTDNLLKLTMAILAAIVGGGSILMVLDRFLKSKDVKDAVESIYLGTPAETQEGLLKALDTIDKVVDQFGRIVQFGREVTDKLPNQETPPNQPVG